MPFFGGDEYFNLAHQFTLLQNYFPPPYRPETVARTVSTIFQTVFGRPEFRRQAFAPPLRSGRESV